MLTLDIPASPGDALINARDCFPDFERLRSDFDIIEFLDFCVGLDAAVLHGSLITVGAMPAPDSNPVLPVLLESEALKPYNIVTSDAMKSASGIIGQPRAAQLLALLPNSIPATDNEAILRAMSAAMASAMDVALEEITEIPLVASAHLLPLYLRLEDIQAETREFRRFEDALAAKYADFREALFAIRQKTDRDVIRIPPIALEILADAPTREHLGESLLKTRNSYAAVRRNFAEAEDCLRSEDRTPKQKLVELAKIRKSINALFTTDELDGVTVTTSFARRLNDTTKIDQFADGVAPSDINWTKLIGWLLELAESACWKFRLRPLHATKERYLQTTQAHLKQVVHKHFGHEITKADVMKADRYLKEIEALKRANLDAKE